MRLLILLVIASLTLVGCGSGSGGGSNAETEDKIYGNWVYETPGYDGQMGMVGILDKNGSITLMSYQGVATSPNTVSLYFRKSVGTYTRNGNDFSLVYSYETCSPIGAENIKLSLNEFDQLLVSIRGGSVAFTMNRAPDQTTALNITAIEDVNCNMF